MKKSIIITLFTILLFSQIVSAEIILSQPKQIYNLGETLKTEIKVSGQIEGIFEANLVCDNEKQLFYAEYFSLKTNEQKSFDKSLRLTGKKGSCHIEAKIADEEAKTSLFTISNAIFVSLSLNKESLYPNDTMEIQGKAIKENNENLDGIAEIYLNTLFLKETEIKSSKFNEKLSLPKLSSYNYEIIVKARDKENLNFGESKKQITMLSIPSVLKIETNEPKAGSMLEITAFLYDQNNKTLEKNISILIDSPEKQELYSREILSGKKTNFELPDNAPIGNWKISAVYEDTEEEQNFYLDKNEKIIFSIKNNILNVKNIGNVPYKKVLVIEIANENSKLTKEIFVDLAIDKEQKLKLSAPEGEYNIKVMDKTFSKISLTGNAINIEKLSSNGLIKSPFFAMLILIGIVILLIVFSHGKLGFELKKATRIFSKEAEEKKIITTKLGKTEEEKKQLKNLFEKYVDKDIADAIAKQGESKKYANITLLFTDIRGFSSYFDTAHSQEISNLLDNYFKTINYIIKRNRGVINKFIGDAVMAIFNEPIKDKNHVSNAVKAALEIRQAIKKLNERLKRENKREISIGIGIDTGMATIGNFGSKEKLEYTAIGEPVNIAFRLQQTAKPNQIIISDRIKDKAGNIESENLGNISLKNINRKITIYNLK